MFKWIVVGLATIIVVAVGAWWYERYRAQAALLEQPVYRILQKHERTLFDDLVERIPPVPARRGEPRTSSSISRMPRSALVATRALAHASQDSLLALVSDMVATAKTLADRTG